ncbi:conjugal transfer protein TrbE [Bradyrhizobium sp. 31Argb]
MLNLKEYRGHAYRLADWLPWACLVAPGVVLNKDGSFQRTIRYRGPDLDSATEAELMSVASRVNNVLKRFGSGWALFFDATRIPTGEYPRSEFPDPVSWLVDEERRAAFEGAAGVAWEDPSRPDGQHFESVLHLTLMYLPPAERVSRLEGLFLERPNERHSVAGKGKRIRRDQSIESPKKSAIHAGEIDGQQRFDSNQKGYREHLQRFVQETDRAIDLLSSVLPEIWPLNDEETLTYLHSCVSTKRHPVSVPKIPAYLDCFLSDEPLTGGLSPAIGRSHLRALTVLGFPHVTFPGLLDELNRLGVAYRWATRFIPLDRTQANATLSRYRRQWFAKRKSLAAILKEVMFNEQAALLDTDASNKALDADAALSELGDDLVAFGYITTTVTVSDEDSHQADEKIRAVERVINSRGFTAVRESVNAVEAWLGGLPGQAYANIRQPIVHTLNLAHMCPLSAVWAGPERCEHLDGPPLLVAKTKGATPFRLSLYAGDVGHTIIVGPTGAGKSVLLSMLALQFRRYPNARLITFDKGRSARATTLALSGAWYELGAKGGIAFQPLKDVAEEGARLWALDWLCGVLAHEGVTMTPDVKETLWSALRSLGSAPVSQRTMTGLVALLARDALRQALQPYTLEGPYGRFLDADAEPHSRMAEDATQEERRRHFRDPVTGRYRRQPDRTCDHRILSKSNIPAEPPCAGADPDRDLSPVWLERHSGSPDRGSIPQARLLSAVPRRKSLAASLTGASSTVGTASRALPADQLSSAGGASGRTTGAPAARAGQPTASSGRGHAKEAAKVAAHTLKEGDKGAHSSGPKLGEE